ncbi:MAG: hypothetical protein HQM08_05950 [Candidatus Riflebacteria bacterium]|nr:hypothetical protein [Candidatus Riflebacteria bacterium]
MAENGGGIYSNLLSAMFSSIVLSGITIIFRSLCEGVKKLNIPKSTSPKGCIKE